MSHNFSQDTMMDQQMDDLKMEEYMDVLYRCKFCPYTCTHSPDMGLHVRENHLQVGARPRLPKESSCASISQPLSVAAPSVNMSTSKDSMLKEPLTLNTYNGVVGGDLHLMHTDEVLSFSEQGQAFMDKSLTSVSFTPYAVPVSNSEPMSNNSTPDLSELINLVKAPASGGPHRSQNCSKPPPASTISISRTNQALDNDQIPQFSVQVAGQSTSELGQLGCDDQRLQTYERDIEAPLPEVASSPSCLVQNQMQAAAASDLFNTGILSTDGNNCGGTQPFTVMAIQMDTGGATGDSNSAPHFIVNSPVPDNTNMPENIDTKEFLLCGLCKLAFATMEDCQTHMQNEHIDLMQDNSGVSIGVQVGGAKRGRKRKSEPMKRSKEKASLETYNDNEGDDEWLPCFAEDPAADNTVSAAGGRVRRRTKPPRALKEDFVVSRQLKQHRALKTTDSNPDGGSDGYKIACPMMGCKARLKTEKGLNIHMECHNLDDTALTCKECQAPHYFWKDLRIHLWKSHKIDCDLLTCETCHYKTDTRHKMNVHMEIHSESKPYTCDICGKGFRQASQMKNHQLTHTKSNPRENGHGWHLSKKCDICDRVFANSKCLKKHKEIVHSKLKPFQCSFCKHTTARKAMMELHMRTHTGEKPFKCDICNYSTGDHNSLRRHKMRHTGQKQYQCTLCTYTCIQSISLKQHMRHKHPGTSVGIFLCSRCPFRSINHSLYYAHMQDHKKGLIPDKPVQPYAELPRVKKTPVRAQVGIPRRQVSVVSPMMLKHPQLHTIIQEDSVAPANIVPGTIAMQGIEKLLSQAESDEKNSAARVFNMQVTMLPSGDTQINADDITRLSECPALVRTGTTALQLIYDTLVTLGGHTVAEEEQTTLLTASLPGGIHTAVLTSLQDQRTVHDITYHLPESDKSGDGSVNITVSTSSTDAAIGVSSNNITTASTGKLTVAPSVTCSTTLSAPIVTSSAASSPTCMTTLASSATTSPTCASAPVVCDMNGGEDDTNIVTPSLTPTTIETTKIIKFVNNGETVMEADKSPGDNLRAQNEGKDSSLLADKDVSSVPVSDIIEKSYGGIKEEVKDL